VLVERNTVQAANVFRYAKCPVGGRLIFSPFLNLSCTELQCNVIYRFVKLHALHLKRLSGILHKNAIFFKNTKCSKIEIVPVSGHGVPFGGQWPLIGTAY
jgi:hypothetical protein